MQIRIIPLPDKLLHFVVQLDLPPPKSMHIFWCFVLVHLVLVSFAHVFAYSLNSGSKYSNRPNNRAFFIRTIFSGWRGGCYQPLTNLITLSVSSELLQSRATICLRKSLLLVIQRTMIFCQKGICNRFYILATHNS